MRSNWQKLESPDFDTWIATNQIVHVDIDAVLLALAWDDGKISRYHHIWLREHCPCDHCHSSITREQILDVPSLPVDIKPCSAAISANGSLEIVWSDNDHRSIYHPGWLRTNSYDEWAQAERGTKLETWGASYDIPNFDFGAVMNDDGVLYNWLSALDRYGLARLENVPTVPGTIEKIAEHFGYIRASNFGKIFDVESKPNPDSNAYLAIELPLHTDLPTRELQPGLQFLHCLHNEAKGGQSIFVDGFHIARTLEAEQPEVYKLLSTLKWPFSNRADYRDYRWTSPLIELDRDGNLVEVRINTFLQAPITTIPHHLVPAAYEAKHALLCAALEDRFRVYHMMKAGDMVTFDNRRVLHARTEFFPETGRRRLQGCYMDRDELKSALRMLDRKSREAGGSGMSPYRLNS